MYENEVFEKQEYNDKRLDQLAQVEKDLRTLLKKVSAQEYLLTAVITLLDYDALDTGDQDMMDRLEAEVVTQAKTQGIMAEGQTVKDLVLLLQTEDHLVTVRQHQLLLLSRLRHLLFRVV